LSGSIPFSTSDAKTRSSLGFLADGEQTHPIARIEVGAAHVQSVQRQGEQDLVEVVAAQSGDALAGDQVESAAIQRNGSRIEGAATEVVNHQVTLRAAAHDHAQIAAGKFDRPGGGLVDHAEHAEACPLEGLEGEVALPRAGVRGYPHHGFQGLVGIEIEVALLHDHLAHETEVARDQRERRQIPAG
jgi:hypothetical protein